MKRAFVTGGAGFLGVNLVEQLVSAGWEVVVFDTAGADATPLEERGISLVRGDIIDPASCERALPAGVEAVFHLAADTSHWSAKRSLHDWMKSSGVVGISGVDTRAVAKRIREKGAMLAKVVLAERPVVAESGPAEAEGSP